MKARLSQIRPKPDQESERDLEVNGFADPQVSQDGASDIPGQKDGAQYGRHRDEVGHDTKQLQNAERQNQRFRQAEVAHSL